MNIVEKKDKMMLMTLWMIIYYERDANPFDKNEDNCNSMNLARFLGVHIHHAQILTTKKQTCFPMSSIIIILGRD